MPTTRRAARLPLLGLLVAWAASGLPLPAADHSPPKPPP